MLDNPQKSNITMHKGLWQNEAYRTFRVVFIVDEPRVYRAPSAF